ncbi:MAG TPA: DUF2795 domain-containing protein [Candidatus Binatia bacterium]|nr:DUF2795 domain-containing protein [Candidatus Binatia bacterium]
MKAKPIEVQKFLHGVDYPASKDDLVRCARGNGASRYVREALAGLPDDEFDDPTDVSEALARQS